VSFTHKKPVNVKICNKKYFSKISQDKHNLKECDIDEANSRYMETQKQK